MLKKAFTLIEILIVVILLGILAAVVVPQFTDVAGEARTSAEDTNRRAIANAIEVYEAREGSEPAALTDLVPNYLDAVPNKADGTAFTVADF